jgi:hypothetical protein
MSEGSPYPGKSPRVVITHDFAEVFGGAERVTKVLAAEFPDAEVWSLLGRDEIAERMGVADRFNTFLPSSERLFKRFRYLTPIYPSLIASKKLPEADVVLSSSYAFSHYIATARCGSPGR